MKKIMIALAAVAMAMGVNAAAVSWSMNVAGKGVEWAGNSAFVMAFNGSDYDTVIDALTVTGTDVSDLAVGRSDIKNSRGNAQTTTNPVASLGVTGDTMFWVVFTEGSTAAGAAITWTDALNVAANKYEPPASGSTFGMTANNFTNCGSIANVPEPTSALMLLLGMAGLALKRKVA